MKKNGWHNLIVRGLVGWCVVVILPAILLSWPLFAVNTWNVAQINSVLTTTLIAVIALVILEVFSRLPGQQAILMTLPILLTLAGVAALVLLAFHLPYSVYYFALCAPLAILFFMASQLYLRSISYVVMAYVPTGRCLELPVVQGVKWISLEASLVDEPQGINAVVADFSDTSLSSVWERHLAEIALKGLPVYNVLQVLESLTGRFPMRHLYENNLGALQPSPFYLLLKRLIDSVVILATLPVVLPVMILVALGIKWESRGSDAPVLFTQQRIGQGGQAFTMYKFRSMIPSSEKNGAKMATADDMRITKFGAFIRKMRLDELPQFFNVLKGDMSLIGPRPEQPSFVEQFNDNIPFYRYRHIVKPGISGWAQVMHGYASDEDETRTKIEYDFYYIKNFSLTLDLLIVVKTLQTMLTGFGAR